MDSRILFPRVAIVSPYLRKPANEWLTIFLSTYFAFMYLILCVPYKFVTQRNTFTVKIWFPQKILCLAATFSGCLWFLRELRIYLLKVHTYTNDPTKYFQIVRLFNTYILRVLTLSKIWLDRESFENIFKFLACQRVDLPVLKLRCYQRLLLTGGIIFVFTTHLVLRFWDWISVQHLGLKWEGGLTKSWNATVWFATMVKAGRFNLFLEENLNQGEFTLWEVALGVVTIVGYLHRCLLFNLKLLLFLVFSLRISNLLRRLLGSCMTYLTLAAVLTLWVPVKAFQMTYLKTDGEYQEFEVASYHKKCENWKRIESNYESIKELTTLINKTVGSLMTLLLIDMMLSYSMYTEPLFAIASGEWVSSLQIFNFISCYAAIVVISADICHKVSNTLKLPVATGSSIAV